MILSNGEGVVTEQTGLLPALGLASFSAPIISVVGAGGKTSVIRRLAQEYQEESQPVIVTTTAHMRIPGKEAYLKKPDMQKLAGLLKREKLVYMGVPAEEGKFSGFPMAFLEAVRMLHVPILIEADGSRGLPAKVPDTHEPVLWEKTMVLIGVLGLDAVGRRIKDVCHRPVLAARLLSKTAGDNLTCQDVVTIGLSRRGMRKYMDPYMRFSVILNKADNRERREYGEEIARLFARQGFTNVLLTAGLEETSETFEDID